MTLYITDNPNIKKDIPGAVLTYQIFNWKIKIEIDEDLEEKLSREKAYKDKELKELIKRNKRIVLIVSRSNYKLIYDVYELYKNSGKSIDIYYWDNYKNGKGLVFIDMEEIENMFNKYLYRGYLSFEMYTQIQTMNFQRIEQFLVVLAMASKPVVSNSDFCMKKFAHDFLEEENTIDLYDLLSKIYAKKQNALYVLKKIKRDSRNIVYSDPYIGCCYGDFSSFKKGENEEFSIAVYDILYKLKGIIPLIDIVRTIEFLIEYEFVIFENGDWLISDYIQVSEEMFEFLNIENWKHFYANPTDISVFPTIGAVDIEFECPICGSGEFSVSPSAFMCKKRDCHFKFKRIIKPLGDPKSIKDWDMIRMLKFGETFIKNKRGGYNKYTFRRSKNTYYPVMSSQVRYATKKAKKRKRS